MQTALNFQGLSIARVEKVLKEMERTVKVGFDYTVGPHHMTTPLLRPTTAFRCPQMFHTTIHQCVKPCSV